MTERLSYISGEEMVTSKSFENVLKRIFEILVLIPMLFIFITGFFWITIFPGQAIDDSHIVVKQSPIKGALLFLVFLAFLSLYAYIISKINKRLRLNVLAIVLTFVSMVLALYWILTIKISPWADSGTCYGLAYVFNTGEFDVSMSAPGTYIAYWPHQLGLISMWRITMLLFGMEYGALRYASIPLIGLMFYSGYKITDHLSDKNIIAIYMYFLLFLTCIPIFGFTIIPYGDLPSIAFIMFSTWMFLECLDSLVWYKMILGSISVILSLLYRNNSIIFLIGFAVVILIKALRQKNKLILILSLIAALLVSKYSVKLIYSNVSEEWKIPYSAWIAMGLRYDTYGWWDNYSHEVMDATDNNTKMADKLAKERIGEEINYFVHNPTKLIDFLNKKIQIQWNAPDFQSFNNGAFEYTQYAFMPILNQYLHEINVLRFFDGSQMFVYFGTILFILFGFMDTKRDITKYILLIGVFGGFLFTLFWETKSRYVFGYYVALIPYASVGIGIMMKKSREIIIQKISQK